MIIKPKPMLKYGFDKPRRDPSNWSYNYHIFPVIQTELVEIYYAKPNNRHIHLEDRIALADQQGEYMDEREISELSKWLQREHIRPFRELIVEANDIIKSVDWSKETPINHSA